MDYHSQLDFLRKTLSDCKLQTLLLSANHKTDHRVDLRLREMIGRSRDYEQTLAAPSFLCAPNTLHTMTDIYKLSYQYLKLPDDRILWIGPYYSQEITKDDILAAVEEHKIPAVWISVMEQFISRLPVILEKSPIHAMLHNFCLIIFGAQYDSINLNLETNGSYLPIEQYNDPPRFEDVIEQLKTIENIYAHESELINAVAAGNSTQASAIMRLFDGFIFEPRNADSLRNIKNYIIINNTLLRKAAQQGHVHPIHIHKLSSEFAHKIETAPNVAALQSLANEMVYSYCRLVNQQATARYSPPIQRTIAYINTDLTADLSLKTLASVQNISAGYLSTLFKKETGRTVTDYVTDRRINQSLYLLNSTNLQVQTIARLCGIPDMNYFSKLFKKYTKMTPLEFRKASSNKG